jgi:molecular chaperone HtpG
MQREHELPPAPKPDLEVNPDHPLVISLEKMRHTDAELAKEVAEQINDQALAAANLLEDPRGMLGRMTGLLEKLLSKPA